MRIVYVYVSVGYGIVRMREREHESVLHCGLFTGDIFATLCIKSFSIFFLQHVKIYSRSSFFINLILFTKEIRREPIDNLLFDFPIKIDVLTNNQSLRQVYA